jgi:hypothetical protein
MMQSRDATILVVQRTYLGGFVIIAGARRDDFLPLPIVIRGEQIEIPAEYPRDTLAVQ